MSPAAVEVRSPIASQKSPSSSATPSETSSGFDFGGPQVRGGFAGGSDWRRPRPRLVKVRKQVGAQESRARAGQGESVGSGFNPFGSSTGIGSGVVGGGNGGFVFGADQRSGVEKGSVKVGNIGFVFGAKENNPESNIKENSVAKEPVFKPKTESQPEPGKFGSGFGLNSSCSDGENTELGSEAERFVFGASQTDSVSNCCSGASVKIDHETEVRKSSWDFKFGTSWFNLDSSSNPNSEKRESNENVGTGFEKAEADLKFDTNRSTNFDKGAPAFVFGASSWRSSAVNEPVTVKCCDEVKPKSRNIGNSDNNLGSDFSVRFNNMYENGHCSANMSSEKSAFKLPDEMEKLNIGEDVNVSGAVKTDSNPKLFSNAGTASRTRRYRKDSRGLRKVSTSSSRNTETNFCDKSSKGHSLDRERIDVNINGSSSQNGVSGTFGSEPFTFQAGFSESDKANQIHKGQGLDNKEPNVDSLRYQEFQPSVSKQPFAGEEKGTRSSPITPERSGVSSMDFGTPLCDPSSLKESLFSEVDKKLECSVKNRSIKDKRLKEMKRKSKKPQVKQCHNQDNAPKENNSQGDPKTPGCYSPMDFSPYQESAGTDQCPKETSVESAAESTSEMRNQEKSQTQSHNSSHSDGNRNSFLFSATPAEQGKLSARKRRVFRRKSRMGVGHDSFVINPSTNVYHESSSMQCSPHSHKVEKSGAGSQLKHGHSSSSPEVHEVCENWRLRGNQAYKTGDLSKAEAFYTQGIVSVPSNERSGSCLEPLLLCYSNRAAARMRLQRVREAIGDCITAAALDPNFIKAQLRAANCHLLLGETEHALQYFSRCTELGAGVCLDRRIILDAADGQQKAQKVAECTNQSAKLLEEKSPDAALSALEIISEALSICLYSEKLLKMKAEALILLGRHDEAIQLCEQTLSFAEKNLNSANTSSDVDGSASGRCSSVRIWRWFLISKSYFHLGRLEAALSLLDKLQQAGSIEDESVRKDIESSTSLAATIRNLLHHKNAGNEAFKSGRYSEAVDHYTLALSSNVESRRFSAICFCNRAAAHQALSQIVDAIADCSLAIALDGSYTKAVSRRAVLHEMIRDYGQAASDLQRLIAILESQTSDKAKESGASGRSAGSAKDLRQAQTHLPVMEEEAKNGTSLNFYLILDSKPSDSGADIKKAYRKAALKHHPDKAGQFLARSESRDAGRLWKEISQEVQKDADRLFKMIGEAYAVLSDPSKRSQHDLDEELGKASKASSGNSPAHRRHSDAHASTSRSNGFGTPDFQGSPFGRSSSRRNFRDNWKTYGNSYSRW